jgi:ATP-dependent DNA helicase RecG
MVAAGESFKLEFNSVRGPLLDAELLEACVCLVNHQDGQILIGVEDDGQISGLHPTHFTRPNALAAFVAGSMVPPLAVEVEFALLPEDLVAVMNIPAAPPADCDQGWQISCPFHGCP